MVDMPPGGAPTPDAGAAPPQPPLAVRAQYTKDLSFENPNAPESLMAMREAPDVNVNIGIDATPKGGSDWEVALTIRGEAKQQGGELLFIAEVVYAGLFTVGDQVPKESVRPMLLIECGRLLFPFAREILATVTRDGGLPPLMLQPVDFVALYRQKYAPEGDIGTVSAPPAGNA